MISRVISASMPLIAEVQVLPRPPTFRQRPTTGAVSTTISTTDKTSTLVTTALTMPEVLHRAKQAASSAGPPYNITALPLSKRASPVTASQSCIAYRLVEQLREVASRVRRLMISNRDPERFHIEKADIVADLERIASPYCVGAAGKSICSVRLGLPRKRTRSLGAGNQSRRRTRYA